MKTFKTQVCTTMAQSNRLLKLGLKKETADMVYCIELHTNGWKYSSTAHVLDGKLGVDEIPAWSLHRLLSIAGDTLDLPIIMFDIGKRMREIGHFYCYEEIIQFIEDAIKEGCLNKEYLEE